MRCQNQMCLLNNNESCMSDFVSHGTHSCESKYKVTLKQEYNKKFVIVPSEKNVRKLKVYK